MAPQQTKFATLIVSD